MTRALAALILLASPAWAQVSNPTSIRVSEEGASQGLVRSINCVGAALLCSVTGGVATFTVAAPALGGANVWTSTNSFVDGNLSIVGSGDPTKIAKFEVDGFTAGTTRTLTIPGTLPTDTIATAGWNNSFTGTNSFAAATTFNAGIQFALNTYQFGFGGIGGWMNNSALTPDATALQTSTTANSFHVTEAADYTYDFNNGPCGTAACTNPTLIIHSAAQDITQYNALASWGSSGRMIKTLTESTATSAFQVAVPSDSGVGGNVAFTVFASDGTIQQTLTGVLQFSAVAEGTTTTCPTPTPAGTPLNAVTAGTLTCTYACLAGTNLATVQFNCVSSATQTTLNLYWLANLIGAGQVIPQ